MTLPFYVLIVQSCALLSAIPFWLMVISCNKKLPDQQKISIKLFHFGVILSVRKKYRALYPNGKWVYILDFAFVCLGIGFLSAVWIIWPHQ
jgi:hypothetical protein